MQMPLDEINERKRACRRTVAQRRKQCSPEMLADLSAQIRERILSLDLYQKARTVFLYMELPGEVPMRALIQQCLRDGKKAAVPVIVQGSSLKKEAQGSQGDSLAKEAQGSQGSSLEKEAQDSQGISPANAVQDRLTYGSRETVPKRVMQFYELRDFDHLVTGPMKILEPDPSCCACLDEEEDALMIMPGVAYDKERHRIGYGGGFYDRYLQKHPSHPTAAVAFDFQLFEAVPYTDTDICPDLLVTPSGIF